MDEDGLPLPSSTGLTTPPPDDDGIPDVDDGGVDVDRMLGVVVEGEEGNERPVVPSAAEAGPTSGTISERSPEEVRLEERGERPEVM
jgi:hypothetical protein